MKNTIFLDATSCGSCDNRRFGEKCRLLYQGEKNQRVRNNVSSNGFYKCLNVTDLYQIISSASNRSNPQCVRFEVFTAVTMKNAVF
jgi:hypothetical protein